MKRLKRSRQVRESKGGKSKTGKAGKAKARKARAKARARGSLMPYAEVAVVPGSHGGFNRISELNNRIAAFIKAQAASRQATDD